MALNIGHLLKELLLSIGYSFFDYSFDLKILQKKEKKKKRKPNWYDKICKKFTLTVRHNILPKWPMLVLLPSPVDEGIELWLPSSFAPGNFNSVWISNKKKKILQKIGVFWILLILLYTCKKERKIFLKIYQFMLNWVLFGST